MNHPQNDYPVTGLEIAVIGMAGKFPGANNIDEFWANLSNGVESVTFFSDHELIEAGIDESVIKDANYVKAKGIISNPEYFDASFFEYTPADAQIMDPQIRLFHECVWEALENAGYDPYRYKGVIGLFAGASNNLWWEAINQLSVLNDNTAASFANSQLTDKDFLTTLISYKLNLKGPSMLIQTACSTSLVAVHIACQELLTGECNIALAGGVSITLPQISGYVYQEGMVMSPDGHCRAFDARAQGTVAGEGLGVVVLKRLEEALQDGDHILAVIKGSNINNDGFAKVGYTAPSIEGQSQMIKKAYYMADVNCETVTYIETHGTGTFLGDPIEIEALKIAFNTSKRNFCALGSVKTNIGHLNEAAGIAGLMKTILALQHQQIPPSLHYQSPNPKIDFENSPFYVNQELREWPITGSPLRVGVSSFGIGGTNAHVILEEAPEQESSSRGRTWQLLLLSAKTPSALNMMAQNLANYLEKNRQTNLADLAYTLQVGRAQLKYRKMVLCSNIEEAIRDLVKATPHNIHTERKQVIFMFPGLGSQYVNMGLELYQKEREFREEVDRCFSILKPMMSLDIKEVIYPENDHPSNVKITDTYVAQPLVFIFDYALAKLLLKWGIKPDIFIGHSIGEYVAACLAGVFSLDDALSLVVMRGKLIQELPPGAMLSVPLSVAEISPYLNDDVSLAAVNSSSLCVLSGSCEAINTLEQELQKIGCSGIKLNTSHAFHSKMMEPILSTLLNKIKQIKFSKPRIPYFSNVSGQWISVQDVTNPEYWTNQLRSTVKFVDGLTELLKNDDILLIEIGAGNMLSTFVKWHLDYKPQQIVVNLIKQPYEAITDQSYQQLVANLMKSSQEEFTDQPFLLNQLGKLWCAGLKIDWEQIYRDQKRYRIPLPAYPFERHRYWYDEQSDLIQNATLKKMMTHTPEKSRYEWLYAPSWQRKNGMWNEKKVHFNGLVFDSGTGFTAQLIEHLEQSTSNLVIVTIGTQYQKENNSRYTINPNHPGDYQALFSDLRKSNKIPQVLIYTWSLSEDADYASKLDITQIDNATEMGFYSLIYLSQAIGELNISDEISLKVITNNLHCVTGLEKLCPEQAMVLGPVKVIPLEYPNLKCGNIDIELPDSNRKAEPQFIESLINDLTVNSTDPIIAYRGQYRWIPGFDPIEIEKCQGIPYRLKKNGTYLITGGLGGIGLKITEYLATTVQAKLILVDYAELPPRTEWEKWLQDHDTNDQLSMKIRQVLELEELGGWILTVSADVTEPIKMKTILMEARQKCGEINGIIHCAGFAEGRMIKRKDRETTGPVFAPKVSGTIILEQLCQDLKLDFFIGCSSLSSIIAPPGQVANCAANNFLNAFSHWKNNRDGTFSVSINWDTWQDVVLATQSTNFMNPGISKNGTPPSDVIEVFKQIINSNSLHASGIKQVIVATAPLEVRFKELERTEQPTMETFLARPELRNEYVAPSNEVEERLVGIWHKLLGFSKVGVDDNFFDLGATSLDIIQVKTKIKEVFNKDIPLISIYANTTIALLSKYISQETVGESLMIDDELPTDSLQNRTNGKKRLQQRKIKVRGDSH